MEKVTKMFYIYEFDELSKEAQESAKYNFLCSKRDNHMDVLYKRFGDKLRRLFPGIKIKNVYIELYPSGTCDIDFMMPPDDAFSFMEGMCDTSVLPDFNQYSIADLIPFSDSEKDIIKGYLQIHGGCFDSADIDKGSYGFWTATDYLKNVFGLSINDYGFGVTDYDEHILDDFQFAMQRVYDVLSDCLEKMAYDYVDNLDSQDMSAIRQMFYLQSGNIFNDSEFDSTFGI